MLHMASPSITGSISSTAKNNTSIFILVLLAILVYFPLAGTGFTTNDDTLISTSWGASWTSAYEAAVTQGRLGFFVGVPLLQAPYYIDNPIYFNLLRFGSPILLLVTLFIFICRTYKSSALSILILGYFFAFIQNGWEQNLLTSYPFAFNIQFTAFLTSLLLYDFYLKTKSIRFGFMAAVLYGISLTLESFFLYGLVFIVMAASHATEEYPNDDFIKTGIHSFENLIPIISIATLYLIAYLTWRYIHPSSYSGNTLKLSDPLQIFKVFWSFSTSAFPGYKFLHNEEQYKSLINSYAPANYSFKTVVSEMRVEWLVKALLTAYITAIALKDKSISVVTPRSIAVGLLLSFVCIFLPNILVSLTEVYRSWRQAGSTSYHYTYFSFIAIAIFLGFLSILIVKSAHRQKKMTIAIITLITLIAAFFSILTDFHNYYVTKDQLLSHKKWRTVNEFIKTAEFSKIPQNAIIYSPSLFQHRNIMENHLGYWTDYIKQKTGKTIYILKNLESHPAGLTNNNIAHIKYVQDPQGDNQIFIFSPKLNIKRLRDFGRVTTQTATIYSYSKNRNATLSGFNIGNDSPGTILINDSIVAESNIAGFSQVVSFYPISSSFPFLTMSSEKEFEIDNLIISYLPINPKLSSVGIALGESFYGWEREAGLGAWSWSKGKATLLLTNFSDTPVNALISMKLTSLTDREVSITGNGPMQYVRLQSGHWSELKLTINLQPGKSELQLDANLPPVLAGNGDPRPLSFRVKDLVVTPSAPSTTKNN
jgi:hypothetical protein